MIPPGESESLQLQRIGRSSRWEDINSNRATKGRIEICLVENNQLSIILLHCVGMCEEESDVKDIHMISSLHGECAVRPKV